MQVFSFLLGSGICEVNGNLCDALAPRPGPSDLSCANIMVEKGAPSSHETRELYSSTIIINIICQVPPSNDRVSTDGAEQL